MRRFYIENQPAGGVVVLNGDEARHIIKVLRLKRGSDIVLFDRHGGAYGGLIEKIRGPQVEIMISETYPAESGACGSVLLQAALKSQKMDFIIQKATELGCSRIVPFFSSRCIPRWDEEKSAQKQHHWQNIAIAAVKQSGIRRVPAVELPCSYEHALAADYADSLKILLWEGETANGFKSLLRNKKPGQAICFIVGPEGGFSEDEARLARLHEFQAAGLGKYILRAETVPLAALAIIGYESGCIG